MTNFACVPCLFSMYLQHRQPQWPYWPSAAHGSTMSLKVGSRTRAALLAAVVLFNVPFHDRPAAVGLNIGASRS